MATRPYQGYPYSNPLVTDAPSVDKATASRWNSLPRRPVLPPQRNVVYVEPPEEGSQVSRPNDSQSDKKEPDPVIYIDVPDSSGSDVAGPAVHYYSQHNENSSDKKEPDPFIYIDLPDSSGSDVAGPASPEPEPVHYYRQDNGNSSGKKDPEPVIYIDVPASSSSDVAGPATPEPEPEYVQETIFYDQFENRRIDQQKSTDESDFGPGRRPPPRPNTPPRTLNLHGAGSSGYPSTYSSSSSSRERYNDMFRPIPVSPYPDLPPAYTEIHTPHTPQRPHTPQLQTPSPERPQEPPRTIVITNGDMNQSPSGEQPSPIGLASADRKVMYCHHCGLRVHTLVIWQSGPVTHAIAFTLLCFMLIPLIVLLYWTNTFKYRNHYCPNCNKKIGYEVPALCIKMTYTTEADNSRVVPNR